MIEEKVIKAWNTRPTIWIHPEEELPNDRDKILFGYEYEDSTVVYITGFYQANRNGQILGDDNKSYPLANTKRYLYVKDITDTQGN
jgi:hypothetical protein